MIRRFFCSHKAIDVWYVAVVIVIRESDFLIYSFIVKHVTPTFSLFKTKQQTHTN